MLNSLALSSSLLFLARRLRASKFVIIVQDFINKLSCQWVLQENVQDPFFPYPPP